MHQAFPAWLHGSRGAGPAGDVQPVLPQRHPRDPGAHGGYTTSGCTHRWVKQQVHGWTDAQVGTLADTRVGALPGPFAELSGHLWNSAGAATPAAQTGPASRPSVPRYPHRHPHPAQHRPALGGSLSSAVPPCLREAAGRAGVLPAGPALLPR